MLEIVKRDETKKSKLEILSNELDILNLKSFDNPKIEKGIMINEKGIFGKKTKTEYILKKGDYISLLGLCEMLKAYRKNIFDESIKFKKASKSKVGKVRKIEFEYNKLKISYSYRLADFCDDIYLNCEKEIPVISKYSNDKIYEMIKPYLFEYLATIYNYRDFLKEIKKFRIGEITTLNINTPDLINNGNINIEIKFGNFAVYNVIIEKDSISSVVFSGDSDVNNFLKENKESLLQNIFINEENINSLLKIFSDTKL